MTTPHSKTTTKEEEKVVFDVAIIGGGVVGLAILRHCQVYGGYSCVLLEQESDLLTKASGHNSGIACTGSDAPLLSKERALIRDSISNMRHFCRVHNIPFGDFMKTNDNDEEEKQKDGVVNDRSPKGGSLVCIWPWDIHSTSNPKNNNDDDAEKEKEKIIHEKLLEVAEESWDAGDTHARILTKEEVLEMEPSLSNDVLGGVHIPGEVVLDPFLFPVALASHARENGAVIKTNFQYDPENSHFIEEDDTSNANATDGGVWKIKSTNHNNNNEQDDDVIYAKCIVNATGILSDLIHSKTHKTSSSFYTWEARPRRGQYRIFAPIIDSPSSSSSPSPTSQKLSRPIQPIPTDFTKGIFIFSSLYNQIIVGPTALEQESRTDDTPCKKVAEILTHHAKRTLKGFHLVVDENDVSKSNNTDDDDEEKKEIDNDCNEEKKQKYKYIGEYVGIRPGTNQRDYQIHIASHTKKWINATGIRSTGLTASLGIGRHVATDLVASLLSPTPKKPKNKDNDDEVGIIPKTTPLPNIKELIKQYNESSDGSIEVNGYRYKVTHKITQFGWKQYAV